MHYRHDLDEDLANLADIAAKCRFSTELCEMERVSEELVECFRAHPSIVGYEAANAMYKRPKARLFPPVVEMGARLAHPRALPVGRFSFQTMHTSFTCAQVNKKCKIKTHKRQRAPSSRGALREPSTKRRSERLTARPRSAAPCLLRLSEQSSAVLPAHLRREIADMARTPSAAVGVPHLPRLHRAPLPADRAVRPQVLRDLPRGRAARAHEAPWHCAICHKQSKLQ